MLDKEAIQELAQAEAIVNAGDALNLSIAATGHGATALPNNFQIHDLEKYMTTRRRARGTMTTRVLADFAAYVSAHQEAGTTVFVDVASMKATAVLNLGTPEDPGHADNKAVLELKQTAAYSALRAVANGTPASQVKVAEFLEDWASLIKCQHDETSIEVTKAITAVRDISIEELRKIGNTEGQLSATRTAFESIQAKGIEQIPTLITFTCAPYLGLEQRTFGMRLSILTTGDKPLVVLRVIKDEEHQEQMAQQFAELIRSDVKAAPVAIGGYSVN
jgi:uncharacterized protein YfdQ (DUF2303 family)